MRLEIPRLPLEFMNEDHAHALALLHDMSRALRKFPDDMESLTQACRAFLQHNREHFSREEQAMGATGFPPMKTHKNEHDQVLVWLEGLLDLIPHAENQDVLRTAIESEIPDWLLKHIRSMDTVTAEWVASHSFPQSGLPAGDTSR